LNVFNLQKLRICLKQWQNDEPTTFSIACFWSKLNSKALTLSSEFRNEKEHLFRFNFNSATPLLTLPSNLTLLQFTVQDLISTNQKDSYSTTVIIIIIMIIIIVCFSYYCSTTYKQCSIIENNQLPLYSFCCLSSKSELGLESFQF